MQGAPDDVPYGYTWDRMATAWAQIDAQQRKRLVLLAEQMARIGTLPHKSTLPPVNEDQERLIPQPDAAMLMGVTVATLRQWEKKAWLTGRIKLSNAVFYTRASLEEAALRVSKAKSMGMLLKLPRGARAFIVKCVRKSKENNNDTQ